jgi:plasmid stabilization system protein ParE
MRVVFHIEALREIREARVWYNRRAPGVGDRFRDLVDAKIQAVARAPESFPVDPKRAWARRARISFKFPYSIVFMIHHEGVVVVLALAHGKRRAGYWAKRAPR